MKNLSKKILSVFLSLIIAATATVAYVPSSSAADVAGTDIPLIYVTGQGSPLVINENGTKREIYPVEVDKDSIIQAAKDNLDVFAKAVITQEWTEFGNVLRDIITPIFSELALDENGNAPNGSCSTSSYSISSIKNKKKVDGKYPTRTFTFNYDWRMDPYKIADQLHQYIEDVMTVTGYDHVALSGRCQGANIVTAYMDKYDCEHVSDFITYCSALNGATVLSKCFAGDIYLDADAVERFCYDLKLSTDEVINELFQSFVTLFNRTYGLDLACWAVNNVWDDIYLDILPQVLIETFGTWPGFWSMVSDEDYVRAKENVFHNQDMDKWANFIEIIDNYHYNVQVKAPEHFREYAERGIEMYNIVKYGYQDIPVSAPSDLLSDSYCSVYNASIGATATTLNAVFDDAYLAAAQEAGTAKYISPDRQIDASTCLFPDTTWFIKNIPHKTFSDDAERLIDAMVNYDHFTVDTNPDFPQYLVFLGETMVPMAEENMNTTEKYKHSFWDAISTFFKSLFKVLSNLIKEKIAV